MDDHIDRKPSITPVSRAFAALPEYDPFASPPSRAHGDEDRRSRPVKVEVRSKKTVINDFEPY